MKKARINLILNTIDINNGRVMGWDGFILGKFDNANDMDQCLNTFANVPINFNHIRKDFMKNELWVRV